MVSVPPYDGTSCEIQDKASKVITRGYFKQLLTKICKAAGIKREEDLR